MRSFECIRVRDWDRDEVSVSARVIFDDVLENIH